MLPFVNLKSYSGIEISGKTTTDYNVHIGAKVELDGGTSYYTRYEGLSVNPRITTLLNVQKVLIKGTNETVIGTYDSLYTTRISDDERYKIWNEENDGHESGLDADLLDGKHASSFALSDHSHSYLPLAGGTMNAGARISWNTNGNLIIGNIDNHGWLQVQNMCSLDGNTAWYIQKSGKAVFISISDHNGANFTKTNTAYTWTAYQDFTAGAGNSGSDMRFKENISTFPDVLDKIKNLNIIQYTWNKEGERQRETFGVYADELLKDEVFSKIVHERPDEEKTKFVEYDRFGVIAIKAIQELQTRIEKLEQYIKQLEDKCK